jgi:3' exoribonuclease, RNase T-like
MDKMLLFLDTEFTGLSRNAKLLSVGITVLSHKGESFYAEFNDFSMHLVNDFVKETVLPNMTFRDVHEDFQESEKSIFMKSNTTVIRNTILVWLQNLHETYNKQLQFVVDVGTYDWLLFSELIAKPSDDGQIFVPNYVDYIPIDVSTMFHILGIDTDVSRVEFLDIQSNVGQHNALIDSKMTHMLYATLLDLIMKGVK